MCVPEFLLLRSADDGASKGRLRFQVRSGIPYLALSFLRSLIQSGSGDSPHRFHNGQVFNPPMRADY